MAKYGKKVQEKIAKNLHEHKHEGKFKSRDQAILPLVLAKLAKLARKSLNRNNLRYKLV